MPIRKTEPIKGRVGWSWDRYEDTVPISTYLIAFVVSDFEYKHSPVTKSNVLFRIWARHNAISQVEFAKKVGPEFLEYFESFFDVKYPLPKQDMIAIPDFSAGAMENWGLITYREALLLYDNNTSSELNKFSIASVIAHELAHQWFGNLVTMKWWTDLWLNEGFATHMAALAVQDIFPKWNSLSHEIVSDLQSVFSLDSLESSHPVSVTIGNPKDIKEIFDTISYRKGSFLLHMIRHFLSEDTFKKGVTRYLRKHKYKNAEQDDLWESLTDQAHADNALPSNLTVKEIMDTWTLQTGFPLVTVTRNYESNSATISQERFLRDTARMQQPSSCWWIPITYTTQQHLDFKNTRPKLWFSCPHQIKKIDDLPDKNTWILLNLNISGLYRINYDNDNWALLINTLNSVTHTDIPVLNRVQLIEDSSALAWVGKLSYDIHFKILDYLQNEKEFLPWKSALNNIETLQKLLLRTPVYGSFKGFMKGLLSSIYKEIGGFYVKITNNKLENIRFRRMITAWGCTYKAGDCVEDAQNLFNKWLENPSNNVIPKEFRSTVYCNAIKYGSEKEWNFLWNQYKHTNIASEKTLLLSALGCAREVWLLERYLEWAIDDLSGIRKQDALLIFNSVARGDIGFYVAKHFLWKKIGDIQNHLGLNSVRVSQLIKELASQMTTEHDFHELKNFTITNKHFISLTTSIRKSCITAPATLKWRSGN